MSAALGIYISLHLSMWSDDFDDKAALLLGLYINQAIRQRAEMVEIQVSGPSGLKITDSSK
jgi:hypothetical protein